jgi:hypothetical protein
MRQKTKHTGNPLIRLLLWIGFISRDVMDGKIDWPFNAPPRWVFKSWRSFRGHCLFYNNARPYIFRNRKGVVKWIPGRLLPRRWGIGWCGFEFGDRGH